MRMGKSIKERILIPVSKKKRRITKNTSIKSGMKPGSLVYIGNLSDEKTEISIITYDELEFFEKKVSGVDKILKEPLKGVKWINVVGLRDVNLIENLGKEFGISNFTLEDVLNSNSRPKMDEYENYLFITSKHLSFEKSLNKLQGQQVSIIVGSDFVISFSETGSGIFEPILNRLKGSKGLIRKMGADYLAYALIDNIVDNYFVILENIEDSVDQLEEELIGKPKHETLMNIYTLKKELMLLRKSVWPMREVINCMWKGENQFIEKNTELYLRDVYDHVVQVIDTTELFVDIITGMLDIYLSSINNRMSEVMKVLTIFSTIFIPITFLAGVFGMNFKYMPELDFKWGYLIFWIIVLSISSFMLYTFKKREWF